MKFVCLNSLLLGLMLAVSSLAAQQAAHITLIDKVSEKPVAYAHLLVEGLETGSGVKNGYLTDIKGKVTIETDTPVRITATFVGYKNTFDTIYPGEKKTISMDPKVYNVDEVVVTAQYQPEPVDKSIYKIKVLGSQAINQRAAQNLNEMLAGELNIRSTHDNALGSSITMQGLEGEHVKFLVDGVPVIGRQNGNLDLQQIDLQNIDHIEIIQGPMSVVYGSNALAGVINVIRKDSDKQKFSAYADGYYESVGVYDFSVGGSYAKKRNSFKLNGGRYFFDGYNPEGSQAERYYQWKPKLQWNFDGTYMYNSKKTRLKFGGDYFYEKIQDKGNPLEVFNYDKAFDKYFVTNRAVFRTEWIQTFSEKERLSTIAAYSFYSRRKNTYLKDLTNLEETLVPDDDTHDTSRFDNIMLRSDYSHSLKNDKIKYQLGIDFNRESGYGKRIKDNYQEIGDYATFFSLNWTPIPQLSIQPGLRAIYNTNYKAPIVYSFNLKWNITPPLSLRVSFAKGFRAPSLKELYLDFVDVNHNIHGNEDLKAETSQNINLAFNYNHQTAAAYNWGIDLGLFYNHISNKIELMMINPDPLVYSYINVDEFYTQGFELSFNNRIYPWLKLNLGLSLTGRKQIDSEVQNNPGFIYSTDVLAQLNYWWQKTDLHFSLFYKYNGAYPYLVLNEDEETEIATMSPYNSLDINVNRWFWKRRINVQIGGKNLLNVTNVDVTGGSGGGGIHSGGGGAVPVTWGRTFFARVVFSFNK